MEQETTEKRLKGYFEANLLDGDDINDCGKAMLDAKDVYETLLPHLHSELQRRDEEIKEEKMQILLKTREIAKEEEREEIVKKIEGQKIDKPEIEKNTLLGNWKEGYNQALDDILKALNN